LGSELPPNMGIQTYEQRRQERLKRLYVCF
jgi:hypothetical protein